MNELSNRQLIHRAYLSSELWKKKRIEAIEHYGTICARCGSYGTDVHHKTYARTGGNELMTDLEILCRPCHETHHRVERSTRQTKRGRKSLNRKALLRFLTPLHRKNLIERFQLSGEGELYLRIVHNRKRDPLIFEAQRLLGVRDSYCSVRTKGGNYRKHAMKSQLY